MKRIWILLGTAVFPFLVLFLFVLGLSPVSAQTRGHRANQPAITTTVTLYDGALGGTPDTQGMFYVTQPFPPSQATQTYSNGVTILDTTTDTADYAGYFGDPALIPPLDRTKGYTLTFTVQVEEETHNNNNRAGFSIILLSQDLLGIELAFWENEIWAQEDDDPGPIFTHAEGVPFTTTTGLITYKVAVLSDTYTLSADGLPILTGPLRDYTAFTGTIDPYETPNLIFLGDDTTSAEARIRLRDVSIAADLGPAPQVIFSSAAYSVIESAGLATITVQLDITPTLPVTVEYTTMNGTAVAPSDYLTTTDILTFTDTTSQTFTITIENDSQIEADETVNLLLLNPVNATLGEPDTAVLTILNDDSPTIPRVMFSSAVYSVTENAGTALITVQLNMTPTLPVTVEYTTMNGTAVAPSDYLTATGLLTFTDTTSQTFTITIENDSQVETDETINLLLLNPVNATLGEPNTAVLTLLNDDILPSFTIYLPTIQK